MAKTIRAAIYARLSLTTEASVSIARQIEECEAYCKARGWQVVLTATDDGVSASKKRPDQRPGWRQISARYAELDRVVYWKTDRLARRVIDFYNLAEETQKARVDLVSMSEPSLDLSTATGRAFAGFLAIFAQMEAEAIGARAKAARGHLLRAGRIAGGERPWPFEAISRTDGPGMIWVPIPERAEAIRYAAAGLIAGTESTMGICRQLDARGLAPKEGGRWDPRSFRRLLSNPALYGATVYHGNVLKNTDGTVKIASERVILDRATFRALQAALEQRGANASTPKVQNLPLLHGIAVCDSCGKRLSAHRPIKNKYGRQIPRYACRADRNGCSSPVSMSMQHLEAWAVDDFLTSFGHLPVVERVEEAGTIDADAVAEIEDALDDVQEQIDATDDIEEATRLFSQRKQLRARLTALEEAAETTPTVRWVQTGETMAEVFNGTDDVVTRRALLTRAYGEIRITKPNAPHGRKGLDASRIIPVPREAMDGYFDPAQLD